MGVAFIKRHPTAPRGFFATEAAGLRWLACAGEVNVVEVLGVADDYLELRQLQSVFPTAVAAREFGAGLARLHSTPAPFFGYRPQRGTAWFGPLPDPFPTPSSTSMDFGESWSIQLRHVTELADPVFQRLGTGIAPIMDVIEAVESGAFNGIAGHGEQSPSRVHGDLWAGNLMWTPEGVVLIDPAAHGGHRLEDLAMLELFGAPYLEEIYAGYLDTYPMPDGWRDDLPAHYLYGLIAHVYLFGGSYASQALHAAQHVLSLDRLKRG